MWRYLIISAAAVVVVSQISAPVVVSASFSAPAGVRISYAPVRDRSQRVPSDSDQIRCYDSGYKHEVQCYRPDHAAMRFSTAIIEFLGFNATTDNTATTAAAANSYSRYEHTIVSVLDELSQNATVRRIEILFCSGEGSAVDVSAASDHFLLQLAETIDAFLIPRPWWSPEHEPFAWQKQQHQHSSGSNQQHSDIGSYSSSNSYGSIYSSSRSRSSIYGDGRWPLAVVLQRYRYDFEPYFRLQADIQYPPSANLCRRSLLVVDTSDCKFTGWGGVLDMHKVAKRAAPFAVSAMYSSRSNDVNESTAFIQGADCPQQRNKWLCAFLPLTNCSLPRSLTDCREENCIFAIRKRLALSLVYDSAAVDAKLLDGSNKSSLITAQKPRSEYQKQLAVIAKQLQIPYIVHTAAITTSNYTLNATAAAVSATTAVGREGKLGHDYVWQNRLGIDTRSELFACRFLLRQNAFYRAQMSQMVAAFRAAAHFPKEKRCVAVHIRRGDRARNSHLHNVTEMCRKFHRHAGDMGCYSVPFAAVEIKHVIEAAKLLLGDNDDDISSNSDSSSSGSSTSSSSSSSSGSGTRAVRSLLVATDDEPWLEEQRLEMASAAPDWNIYYMKAPDMDLLRNDEGGHLSRGYWTTRWGGTESGVFLQAQMQLLQQCEAFVGHFQSAMTKLMYQCMCISHGAATTAAATTATAAVDRRREAMCPPGYDISTMKKLQTNFTRSDLEP